MGYAIGIPPLAWAFALATGFALLAAVFAARLYVRYYDDPDGALWVGAACMAILILVYALTVPAICHHGRYLMPLIPLVIVMGVGELRRWHTARWTVLRWSIPWLVGVMFIALWLNGATTYALQVRLLEEQHAAVGHWVNEHTPADAIVASHDIGLLGYWGERQVVDLVGLVTPEAISIMHDQQALADLCRREGVDYLVVFLSFHQELVTALGMQVIYEPPGTEALCRRWHIDPFVVYGRKQEQ